MPSPKILILTAAFGEGHNTAANNLSLSLKKLGAHTLVADPCMLATPQLTLFLCYLYRLITTHTPKIWRKIYDFSQKTNFAKKDPFLYLAEKKLSELIRDYQPQSIVCTYPIYPYLLPRIAEAKNIPVHTIITDSLEIHAVWKKAQTDSYHVTDPFTKSLLIDSGIADTKIIETGFSVHPSFAEMTPLPAVNGQDPFRILYFPTAKKRHFHRISTTLLEAHSRVNITIVLGKNIHSLLTESIELKKQYPNRIRLVGWTKHVPKLFNSHHLAIGKAGGATVHEAIAAQCPMLIHHLVPGQEEGNLKLLEKLNAGSLTETTEAITETVQNIMANDAKLWIEMKTNLANYHRNDGSMQSAQFILQSLDDKQSLLLS